jgi:small-conductance mechanosensitive channel
MERRLLVEMMTMKGGQGRLEKIRDEYEEELKCIFKRIDAVKEYQTMIDLHLAELKKQKVDSNAEPG